VNQSNYKNEGRCILFIMPSILNQLFNPFSLSATELLSLSFGLLMVGLWVSECFPMPVVALLPLIIFPVTGLDTFGNVSNCYSDPVIYLFMGGFFIALALEKWELHKRISLQILRLTGFKGDRVILGFMISTYLISMWISNTATTMMMYPIAMSMINVLKSCYPVDQHRRITVAILLSIAYASNIGGLSTIIGTPPNSAFAAYIHEHNGVTLGFAQWFRFAFPLSALMLTLLYIVFAKVLFRIKVSPDETELPFLKNEISKLGPWKREQVLVLCVFIITAAFWILKDVVNKLSGLDINDSAIALTGAMLLFVLPSNQKSSDNALEADELVHQHKGLLTWKDTIKMEWGILLMFGGGIALAKQLQSAGLLSRLGNALAVVTPDNLFLIIIVIASISVFLSEIMSNIAQVIVLSPIVVSLAESLHLSPLILGIPMCMAASCSGMLPMGTPPNAIVYGSGLVPLRKMLQAGLWINLISILVISIWTWLFLLKIF